MDTRMRAIEEIAKLKEQLEHERRVKFLAVDEWLDAEEERDEARSIARKLYAENKRLKAELEADRWISVEDEMPEKGEIYTVFSQMYEDIFYYDDGWEFYNFNTNTWDSIPVWIDVTHWKFKSQPPQGL